MGFTLVEIFIALAVGLVLVAGVLTVFVGMKTTTSETTSYGVMQENGRFALTLITDDLLRQSFWGDLAGSLNESAITSAPNAIVAGDCVGMGANNRSFPLPNGHFRAIWGTSNNAEKCMAGAKDDSDVIHIKRAVSFPYPDTVADPLSAADLADNRYFINVNANSAAIFNGTQAIPDVNNGRVWEYQNHIYFVSEDGTANIPVLNRGNLVFGATAIDFNMVVEGIERIYFMYGIDTNADGAVNTYLSATNMTDIQWDNGNSTNIVAVKVFVLARDILPDNKYTNTNVYTMGDSTFTPPDDDNFRRLLFSSTVVLNNARNDSW